MKKTMSLILALTIILSFGTFAAQAATTEATNVTTVAPVNYADSDTYSNVKLYRTVTTGTESIISPSVEAAKRPEATAAGQVTTNSTYSNGLSSQTYRANNSWYAIDLGESRKISRVELVQHYYKLKNYKLYYTNDETLIEEISTFDATTKNNWGLTKNGEVSYRTHSNSEPVGETTDWYDSTTDTPSSGSYGKDMVYHGEGILDRLTLIEKGVFDHTDIAPSNDNDGYINGTTIQATDVIEFDEIDARCLVLLYDEENRSHCGGTSMMLWSFKAFGTEEKTSTDIAQFPKTYPDLADKDSYSGVSAVTANGNADALVDSDSAEAVAIPSLGTDGEDGVQLPLVNYATAANGAKAYSMGNGTTDYEKIFVNDSIDGGYMSLGCIENGTGWKTSNSWFIIDLGTERKVSSMLVDQWKDRFKGYEVYATTNSTAVEAELTTLSALKTAYCYPLSGSGESFKTKGSQNPDVTYESGLLDTLKAEGALVASGTLTSPAGVATESTVQNTIQFSKETTARYIIFVIRSSYKDSYSMMLDYVEVLGYDYTGIEKYDNTWFGVDLGAEKSFNEINVYQQYDRMKNVSVYSATAAQYAAAEDADRELDASFIRGLTLLKSADISKGSNRDTVLNASKDALTTPNTISFADAQQSRYLIFVVESANTTYLDIPVYAVDVIASEPVINYVNAYPTGGIDYTVKFVNDGDNTKMYALVTAQYNEDGEMIAHNIEYVTVAPLYAKSFTGNVTNVDTAKQIKVFSWCMDELKPMETEYTFNIQ